MGVMEEIFEEFGLDPTPKRKCDVSKIKRKYLNIAYCDQPDGKYNLLDIYLPECEQEEYPVLIQIHGGGFLMVDKGDYLLEKYLKGLDKGYAVVSVNYHYSTEKKFPEQIREIKTAIRFLRHNRKKYFLNTDRIAIGGESAGGYLASMVALTPDDPYFEGSAYGTPDEKSTVSCCVDYYGPTDMLLHDKHMQTQGVDFIPNDHPRSPTGFFLGGRMSDIPHVCDRANPLKYVSKTTVPVMIFHGEKDVIVPPMQSQIFYDRLKKNIEDRVALVMVPHVGHEDPTFETNQITDIMYKFIEKYI